MDAVTDTTDKEKNGRTKRRVASLLSPSVPFKLPLRDGRTDTVRPYVS